MQSQFLTVIDAEEATRRFNAAIEQTSLAEEMVPLGSALHRVLARDLRSRIDVPGFDRSNYDGYALQATDTHGATEEAVRSLKLIARSVVTGQTPQFAISPGQAARIATGGMLPRGADAIMMVEHAVETDEQTLEVARSVSSGFGVTYAGTDIAQGEIFLRQGELLTSRELGVAAAVGLDQLPVVRQPKVAIISTGDELVAPGQAAQAGQVYDSNRAILMAAVRELGGEPLDGGIVNDDPQLLRESLQTALVEADVVLLSGGTSKGEGDLCYRIVAQLTEPGIIAHGVALKPGKPICLASHHGKPVVILPGFPTSAVFTFHEFVAPVIRRLAGRVEVQKNVVIARLANKVNSEIGRTEYLLVSLVKAQSPHSASLDADAPPLKRAFGESETVELAAYPMGKGSGSVTTFSRADGFITIDRQTEMVAADTQVSVTLLGREVRPADLVVIGSHCERLDMILTEMHRRGWRTKFMAVGSTAGLEAARRGECDVAGMHLLDESTGTYNQAFITESLTLIPGYARTQGIVMRKADLPADRRDAEPADIVDWLGKDPHRRMINRNRGSGTRILIDKLLNLGPNDAPPAGYSVQVRNHSAVVVAIGQHRADWGVAIESVVHGANIDAGSEELAFLPIADEQFDFAIPSDRLQVPAVTEFIAILREQCAEGQA